MSKKDLEYSASSPDELALVEGANALGYKFKGKDYNQVIEIEVPYKGYTKSKHYKLLNVLEFSSNRKRMSIIVEDIKARKILLLTKGADSVIEKLLNHDQEGNAQMLLWTKKHVQSYAEEGLRTLFMAKRELTSDEYEEWNEKFQDAANTIKDRDARMEEINSKIEKGLTLIGSSAIEDNLQEDVKQTLVALKQAGIKIWVLTGDKVETAINIGYSAGLLDKNMISIVIEASEHDNVKVELGKAHDAITQLANKRIAIIISGETLTVIHAEPGMQREFMDFAPKAEVVIACRVSPKQKGDIVNFVKVEFPHKTTLAIGDGANDVTMIMKADVGVGIAGREGMQAARASDFSIGQFKFLKPLLFIHGREAYRRNTEVVCYSFYKNILYIMAQYWYGFASVFSGQPLYEPFIY